MGQKALNGISGEKAPVLGQGTWHMRENPERDADEIAALEMGIRQAMTLIDTAEMYGDSVAKELVGEAIEHCRKDVFIVSKVLPHHLSASLVRDGAAGRDLGATCVLRMRV